ncbi:MULTISPECIES: hypothetical protein [unclassified Cobetia]|uniref:hypothetical protein n=1 Tax=unclassified Cobetia TaxID=2609414 RepID=UPI0020981D5A|nr:MULTISPECIES: hypothetical protein [unclassified Cobetia]MCO7234026.1 hypothetical protein [Cobetia sp. Dlab-2-AX]MCO7237348.1 hypothetical protein [Cobetia sp. Dlab-2-U]
MSLFELPAISGQKALALTPVRAYSTHPLPGAHGVASGERGLQVIDLLDVFEVRFDIID